MSTWYYDYSGVSIASELELPEWASFAIPPTGQTIDVAIHYTTPLAPAACDTYQLTVTDDQLVFQLPNVGRYHISAGRDISIAPCHGVAVDDLRLFLLGSAWGALSYQRGWFPLHASVVQMGSGAVAFCAPSGGGKSSLAAWLAKQGYPLLSDDLCRLDVATGAPPQIWPTLGRFKLWRDALVALDWQSQPLIRDQQRLDKFHLPAPAGPSNTKHATQPVPLCAIYQLTWGELAIQRLHGLQAVRAVLAAATYRPEFVNSLAQTAAHWQQVIDLVSQVPVFHLQRPRNWTLMPTIGAALSAQGHVQVRLAA